MPNKSLFLIAQNIRSLHNTGPLQFILSEAEGAHEL